MKLVRERIEFKREGTPYEKMGIGKSRYRPYPEMTPDEFQQWFETEIKPYFESELGIDMVIDLIVYDESSTDKEIVDYLLGHEVSEELINKLILMRPYFWDSRYENKIGY